jgi:hypothetical protein
MPGVRLHHPEFRSCTYTLVHLGRPLTVERRCGVCGYVHFHKTYHLGLDNVGDVVVSEVVYSRLREAGLGDLKVLNEIKTPEPMRMDMNAVGQERVVSREEGIVRV